MTAPFQSKLIPHEDFIRECRNKRWTYPRIAAALLEKHNLKVGATTIFDFVKVRARKRTVYALPPKENEETQTNTTGGFFEPPPAETKPKNESRKLKYKLDL
jgi:hypothetical protein